MLSPDPMAAASLDGHLLRVNPAFAAALGLSETEMLSRNVLDLVHPGDVPEARAALAALAAGEPVRSIEARFAAAGGEYKSLAWNAKPFPERALAYIVARQKPEREAESPCVCAVEYTTDAFFAVDCEWRLIRVNRQAETLWTLHRDGILGRNLWAVFPEAANSSVRGLYEEVMRTGVPAHREEFYPFPPHPGWFEIHAYPSREGLAVYFRDIGARRQSEEKINQTLQEKEVLLREVHHRVKNNLQVICSMLRLKERNLADPTLLQVLRECRERVMAMAMLHDQLHRAKDFSHINLGEYMRNLAASLFCSYGVNSADIDLRLDIEDVPVTIDTAIPCGLIVNELVSNSLRHAFPDGRKGSVRLGLHALAGGSAELIIEDDGRGFEEMPPSAGARSLGLWLVELLAAQIGAAVERSSKAGTRYWLVFQDVAAPALTAGAEG